MDPLTDITTAGSAYRAVQAAGTGSVRPALPAQAQQTDATGQTPAKGIQLPEDRVTLSGQKPAEDQQTSQSTADQQKTAVSEADPTQKQEPKPGKTTTTDGTSTEDPQVQAQISRLKQNEEKVKAHEAAHKAAGGNLASSASYSYTKGPDGRSYISGGEVQIDMSDGNTPEETITRMQQVIRAAMAPADPSGQDRSVAAAAASRMAQAQQEKMQSESTAATSGSSQSVDPAQEAQSTAQTSETTQGTEQSQAAVSSNDARIRNAYGNPAVQSSDTAANGNSTATQRPSGNSTGSSLFSSFA